MTKVFTDGARDWGWLLHENGGTMSREEGTLKGGIKYIAGTPLEKIVGGGDDGKLQAFTGHKNTAGDVIAPLIGILGPNVNATDGPVLAAYGARLMEVNDNLINYPVETTGGGEKASTLAGFAKLTIIVRSEG